MVPGDYELPVFALSPEQQKSSSKAEDEVDVPKKGIPLKERLEKKFNTGMKNLMMNINVRLKDEGPENNEELLPSNKKKGGSHQNSSPNQAGFNETMSFGKISPLKRSNKNSEEELISNKIMNSFEKSLKESMAKATMK